MTFNEPCNLKKNDKVRFLPEYKDGEKEFDYLLLENPDGGRVKVVPIGIGLEYPPVQVVKTDWIEKISD